MTFFLIGYCVGLFGTLVAIAKKMYELIDKCNTLASEVTKLRRDVRALDMLSTENMSQLVKLKGEYIGDIARLSKMIVESKPKKGGGK